MAKLSKEQKALLEHLIARVRDNLGSVLNPANEGFPTRKRLLRKSDRAAEHLLETGTGGIHGFQEIHNELCVAVDILENQTEPICECLGRCLAFSPLSAVGFVSIISPEHSEP